jgi:hypothetical protein
MLGRPERAFLLSSLLFRELDAGHSRALVGGGLDWAALVAAARVTGVVPLLANAVAAVGGGARSREVPAELLHDALGRNAAENALLVREVAGIDAVLRGNGIEAIVLKGAALAASDPAYAPLRHMKDVDLLVPPEAAGGAVSALEAAGLVSRGDPAPLLTGGAHPYVVKTRSGLQIELHVRLGEPAEAGNARARAMRAHCARTNPLGLCLPAPEDLLGLCAWHALVHHAFDVSFVPRLVADVHALLARGADPKVAAARHDSREARPVARALALVEQTRRAAARPSRFGTLECERPYSRRWRALKRAQGERLVPVERLVRAPRALLFPPRDFMAARYGVPARSRLLPLLYLYRPFRGLFRALTGI